MTETVTFNWECRQMHMKMSSSACCDRYRDKFVTCGDCRGPEKIHDEREMVLSDPPPARRGKIKKPLRLPVGKRKKASPQQKEKKVMADKTCNHPGCEKALSPGNTIGFCSQHKHLGMNRERVSTCRAEGCEEGLTQANKSGYCRKHYHITLRGKSRTVKKAGKPESNRGQAEKKRPETARLTLDFSEYPELLERINERAKRDFRAPGQQVMFVLSYVLEEES